MRYCTTHIQTVRTIYARYGVLRKREYQKLPTHGDNQLPEKTTSVWEIMLKDKIIVTID